ncbi:MAG: hypothetical protein MZV64_13485 [Ignavibacteriales bacterium]|nr:hypothetical protein [Ignavibacteriales bacterium]
MSSTPSNVPAPPISTARGGRAERGDDPREQPVALLPLGAGDVERDDRPLAVRRAALELDEASCRSRCGSARRRPTRARTGS